MAYSEEYINYVLDQFSSFGEVHPKKMFGGVGLFFQGLMFSLIADDTLYLKVDDSNRSDFERDGCMPFKPFVHKKMTMSYYNVPVEVLENRDVLAEWAKKAFHVAMRGKKK